MASLTDDTFIDKCIGEYRNGKSLRGICRGHSIDRGVLRDILLYNGIVVRGGRKYPRLGTGQVTNYINMYNSGTSMIEIERKCGINPQLLSYILRQADVSIRSDGRLYTDNLSAFTSVDDEISAYVLGFFYADASIESAGKKHKVDVSLAYKDYDHLCRIRDWISSSRPIKERKVRCNGKVYSACRLTVSSKVIVDRLILLGCFPNKSLTLVFPTEDQVPRNLLHHFMRGYFDGDGCISNSGRGTFGLMGTLSFLTEFFKVLLDYGITPTKIYKPSRCYSIQKGGKHQLGKIHKFLYKDSHIHLERKKVIFDGIVNNCPCAK